jgi:DNA-binding HxlR family transcriptional regulator
VAGREDTSNGEESVKGVASRIQPRAGSRVLSLLSTPLNFLILRALSERPLRLAELRKVTGLPAQTTLRGHLASLNELGAVAKRPTQQMPYTVENELTPMGRDLLYVGDRLEAWLNRAPDGPISLESGGAKGAVKALLDGWGSRMMRALAARPLSLTELDRLISDLSYPALERRLCSMRLAGLVEAQPSVGAGTPYALSDWARRGIGPLVAAGHCEHRHISPEAAPVTQIDV